MVRLVDQQQQQGLGYFYGYQVPSNPTMGPEFYSIARAYPNLQNYYGLLSGPAFSLAYALSGLFWGKAADKYNRNRMLALCCIGWSLTSIATGSFNSLAVLALMRFGLGAT